MQRIWITMPSRSSGPKPVSIWPFLKFIMQIAEGGLSSLAGHMVAHQVSALPSPRAPG